MKIISSLLALASLHLGVLGDSSVGAPRVRLVDGDGPCSGRLEIYHNNSWGAVCYQPLSWELPITGEDLRQMGCGTTLQVFPEGPSRQTSLTFIEYETMCAGVPSRMRCNHEIKTTASCDSKKYVEINSLSPVISGVRFVDGNSCCDGALEVYFNHTWQRVSSEGDSVDRRVAEVACRQLRGATFLSLLNVSSEGRNSMPIACTGQENHLSQCLSFSESPFTSTSHHLGAMCSKPGPTSNTRLVGGSRPCEGQVEVFSEKSWKMICYEGRGIQLAAVVCKELQCGSAVNVVRGFGLWSTAGQLLRNFVSCQGHESKLSECMSHWRDRKQCEDPEDTLGVACSGSSFSRVRLVNGHHSCEGKVEVYYNNTWGSVCDHDWDIRDAAMVCRQAGCGPAMEATAEVGVSTDSGPVWLDNVFCSGTETDLSLCGSQLLLKNQCNSSRRAGVRCSPSGISDVWLVNGSSRCAGRLEVYYDDTWGTVCDDAWDARDAAVVCKQLGCGSAIETTRQNPFGLASGPVWLKRVFCSGSESHLSQCGSWTSQQFACSHTHDVGVTCSGADTGIVNMRLVNGNSQCAGKVEVFSSNTWGRVHSDLFDHALWDLPDAAVVCKQQECGPLLEVSIKEDPHEENNYMSMREKEFVLLMPHTNIRREKNVNVKYLPWGVFCSGTETSISQCGTKRMTLQPYQHIYVECAESGISGVRLVDGGSSCAGRVEVKYKNTWGTVCDYRWDMEDAAVVCRELGCGSAVEAPRGAHFKSGSDPVWLKAVFCSGNETHFSQCGSVMTERYPCDHSQDAGVICSGAQLNSFWSSTIFRFIIYSHVFSSIHLGFFLYGYLEDKRKQGDQERRQRRDFNNEEYSL